MTIWQLQFFVRIRIHIYISSSSRMQVRRRERIYTATTTNNGKIVIHNMGRKVAGWAFSCCRTPTFIGPLFVFNLEIVTQKIYNIDIIDINNYISILSQNSKTFTYGSAMHMRLLPWLWTSSANRRTLYGGRYSYKSSNLFEPIMCNVWIRNLINTNRHFVLINLYDSKQFIYHHHSRTKPTIVWQKCKRLPLTQNEKKSAFRQRFCLDLFSVLHSDLYIH